MKVTRVVMLLAILAAVSYAAPLPPNVTLTKPGVGLPPPNYTVGLPSYFTPANLVKTLVAPMTIDFVGTVTTQVYTNNVGGYTFAYVFQNNGTGAAPDLVRATFDPANWGNVTITDAGADGSGLSTPAGQAPNWSNGDPYLIARADLASGTYPFLQWRVANVGTVIAPGDRSSVIWLETGTASFTFSSLGLLDGGRVGKAQVLVVPAPAAALLGALGLGMIGWLRRR